MVEPASDVIAICLCAIVAHAVFALGDVGIPVEIQRIRTVFDYDKLISLANCARLVSIRRAIDSSGPVVAIAAIGCCAGFASKKPVLDFV